MKQFARSSITCYNLGKLNPMRPSRSVLPLPAHQRVTKSSEKPRAPSNPLDSGLLISQGLESPNEPAVVASTAQQDLRQLHLLWRVNDQHCSGNCFLQSM